MPYPEDLNVHQRRRGKFRYQNISARKFNEDIRQLAMKPLRCVETSGTNQKKNRRHVPERRSASNAPLRIPENLAFSLLAGIPWPYMKSHVVTGKKRQAWSIPQLKVLARIPDVNTVDIGKVVLWRHCCLVKWRQFLSYYSFPATISWRFFFFVLFPAASTRGWLERDW